MLFRSDQAIQLLEAIISILTNYKKNYSSNLHNSIFSYAEFCSHILSLNYIRNPPPFTKLIIPINEKLITYTEGLLNEFPCIGDITIPNAFILLPPDHIITIWTAFLLEKNTVIFTSDPNVYFNIIKTIGHLMFPLSWSFPKGLIPNLELLCNPTPYCFGILKSPKHNLSEIYDIIDQDEIKCIFLNVENDKVINVNINLDEPVFYPHGINLNIALKECCEKYNIKYAGELPNNKQKLIEFAMDVQCLFYKDHCHVFDCTRKNFQLK